MSGMSETRTEEHGNNAYTDNRRCRCDDCRTAHRRTIAARRTAAYAHTAEHGLPAGIPHGTVTAYDNWGCRCDGCRTASNDRRRARDQARRARTAVA